MQALMIMTDVESKHELHGSGQNGVCLGMDVNPQDSETLMINTIDAIACFKLISTIVHIMVMLHGRISSSCYLFIMVWWVT